MRAFGHRPFAQAGRSTARAAGGDADRGGGRARRGKPQARSCGDALYLNLSIAPTERRGEFHTEQQGLEHILSAAGAAGIKRIGYLSAMIHDSPSRWWVLDVWRNAIARIKDSGIPYTIFYPTNFMETLPQRHMLGRTFVMTGWSRNRDWWIAGRDFGRQVARSFMLPEAENREYAVQGPQPITYNEAGRRFARAAGARRL